MYTYGKKLKKSCSKEVPTTHTIAKQGWQPRNRMTIEVDPQ